MVGEVCCEHSCHDDAEEGAEANHRGIDDLPIDIVLDIFWRLDMEHRLPPRLVSKQWRNAIDHPCLINTQMPQQKGGLPMPLILSHSGRKRLYMNVLLAKEEGENLVPSNQWIAQFQLIGHKNLFFDIKGSCNGLIYFEDSWGEGKLMVSNPLKKQHVFLPPMERIPTPRDFRISKTCGLGFDISTGTFKMVCVFHRESNFSKSSYELGTIVHTLGASDWRNLARVPPYPICGRPVYSREVLHWVVNPEFVDDASDSGMIVSFDCRTEQFGVIPRPEFCSRDYGHYKLLNLDGDLAVVDNSSSDQTDIWVMEGYNDKENWTRRHRIYSTPQVVGRWKQDEILLKFDELYAVYNPITGIRYLEPPYVEHNSSAVGRFMRKNKIQDSTIYIHSWSLVSIPNATNTG
ncbi:hypothetical protein RJ639_019438 [Escallonia herrerae]|uniref:F-box domain-containing protein n=1 Tax=Escallonia herrerae TaxID=1293975 RepID=A0AA89AHY7_9ASTE|nr:hypothetical protein RJ639_019438 [Escallonia herrerae]